MICQSVVRCMSSPLQNANYEFLGLKKEISLSFLNKTHIFTDFPCYEIQPDISLEGVLMRVCKSPRVDPQKWQQTKRFYSKTWQNGNPQIVSQSDYFINVILIKKGLLNISYGNGSFKRHLYWK